MDVTYNASGEEGYDGTNGSSYYDTSSYHGRNGGNATAPGEGMKGGTIKIKLSSVNNPISPGHIHIQGSLDQPFGQSEQINEDIFLGANGLINLFAQGGRGGNGANGGKGQDGAKGTDGDDATTYSAGTDGTSGYDGGHAGSGSSGADGGSGGVINVIVPEEDSHLLLLLGTHNVEGGPGGSPGRNGQPGTGGRGGRGGNMKRWSETRRDSQGNTYSVTKTRAGGVDGADGRNGNYSNAHLKQGKQGMRGRFSFGVRIGGSVITYSNLFRLELVDFKHEAQNASGVIEPSGRVIIHSMKFKNSGGMPTPRHKDIRIALRPYSNMVANSTQINAPKPIQPNDTAISRDPLHVRINDVDTVSDGNPLQQSINVGFTATMTDIERPLQLTLQQQLHFVVQYPINVSEVIAIHVPGDKHTYELFWSVTNIGHCDLGRQSNCGRQIRAVLNKGETTNDQQPLELGEVNLLHAGESKQLAYRIQLDDTLGTGWQHFSVTLQIGKMDQPDSLKSIQRRRFLVKPATLQENDLLLCTYNNPCTNVPSSWNGNVDYKGEIDIRLSNPANATNMGEVLICGTMKYNNGCKIELDHQFSFRTDGHIYLSTGNRGGNVTVTVAEHESHLLLLLAHNFNDPLNALTNWKFKIVNETYNRIEEFDRPFKLELRDFVVHADNLDNIYEPSGRARIRNLRVCNVSQMPTPSNHEIRITLNPSDWIVPDDTSFTVPKSIPAGGEVVLQKSFEFSLCDDTETNHLTPLRIPDNIKFNAIMTAGNRILPSFSISKPIQIQYPIEIGEFVGFRHPGEDEIFSIFWCIKNLSRAKFGKNSELGRMVETSVFRIGSDENRRAVIYMKDLESFAPNEIISLKTKTKLERKNDKYTNTQFESHLRLGTPEFPETPRQIQLHRFLLSPFTLSPLRNTKHNPFNLILNLGEGRLTANGTQPNDHSQPGEIRIRMSAPNRPGNKPGDLTIEGTLKYTNGWKTEFNDRFSLEKTGQIYLIPSGNNNATAGTIDIESSVNDTHLLYLIHEATLVKCRDVLLRIQSSENEQHYRGLYKLELMDFECEPEDQSSIYEPGARIIVRNIIVKNTGQMPTPSIKDVKLSVIGTIEIISTEESIILPKSIGASHEVTLNSKRNNDKVLDFNIKSENKPSYGKPLEKKYTVNLRAIMGGIERQIISFKRPKELDIKYPIQICPKAGVRDFATDDETMVIWVLNNISQISFGAESDCKRLVKVGVTLDEVEPPNSLRFFRANMEDKESKDTPSNYYEQEISLFQANQEVTMFCTLIPNNDAIGSEDDSQVLITAKLSIALKLGSIKNPAKVQDIEIRKHEMIVSPKYEVNRKADLLIVINRDTRKEEHDAWRELCKETKLRSSVWDLSRMGHLDLFTSYSDSSLKSTRKSRQEYTDSTIVEDQVSRNDQDALEIEIAENSRLSRHEASDTLVEEIDESFLAADFREKTIVILNNLFEDITSISNLKTRDKTLVRTLDYVDPNQIYKAFRNYGIKFYIVGTDIDKRVLEEYFIPKKDINSFLETPEPKIKNYIKYKKGFEPNDQAKEGVEGEGFECIKTHLRPIFRFMSSTDSYTKNKVSKLSKSLQTLYPERRHLVIVMNGEKRKEDKIFVCRTVDRTERHLGYLNLTEDGIHDPKTIISNENKIGLLSCITFSRRLNKLKELISDSTPGTDSSLLESLQKLLEVDLIMELIGLCKINEKKGLTTKPLSVANLKFFKEFCDFVVHLLKETKTMENKYSGWALGVMANLKITLYCGRRWTDFFKSNKNLRIRILERIVESEYQKVFEKVNNHVPSITVKSQSQILAREIKKREQGIKQEWSRVNNKKDGKFNFAVNKTIGFLSGIDTLKNDWNILNDNTEIVVTDKDYRKLESDYTKKISIIQEKIVAFRSFGNRLAQQKS
ncbi:16739_t:CDS:2 [Acaulospora morrowiae]|uniref:16739_t:CDS:1 n=1 Tax=Acaulospora morrowiae TaxID=94023 RepID=A0A9N8VNZ9_9GLOM|nr:16739_t:CDS:2 [Acaulospora morrowiae]